MKRSEMMSRVRGQDTRPEWVVRRLVYRMGYRYRLRSKDLPGRPDLVFPGRKKVIFVHGCFWHQHRGCAKAARPKTNTEFWNPKLDANVERDKKQLQQLNQLGWSALVVWECEVDRPRELQSKIAEFLDR